jgi:hypothetical protein
MRLPKMLRDGIETAPPGAHAIQRNRPFSSWRSGRTPITFQRALSRIAGPVDKT